MPEKWSNSTASKIFQLPFPEIMHIAQTKHRENFCPKTIQISALLNIKTGSCPENCSYCPQSAHYNTGLKKEPLMQIDSIIERAKRAKHAGSDRFCMGAAWRSLHNKDVDTICTIITEVKNLGLETCVTLGMLTEKQAKKLKAAGLDFYNHNIDTSEEYYKKIISTRTFQDRLNTLENVRNANIKICCGGIIGMGESNEDRIAMLVLLANLATPPESIPINKLIPIPGTPLENSSPVDPFDFVRTICLARILMPKAYVRLSAGRDNMSDEMQALCFLAGANSIFYGDTLLTAPNPKPEKDNLLFQRLGLKKFNRNTDRKEKLS